jgi:hypothetical protein
VTEPANLPGDATPQPRRSWPTEAMTWIVFALAAVALTYALYVNVVVLTLPAPQEYREAAIVLGSDRLLRGENPYALANQPVYTNIYGIGYHLVVYPLARVVGSTFLVHRAVSMAFALASCALVFATLRRARVDARLAFAAAALLYCDLALRVAPMRPAALPLTILARPDAMGLFLFLLSLVVPWWKRFSTASLAVSATCAIAAFFTKPYFVLGLPVVAAYLLLLRSWRRGLLYGVVSIIALIGLLALATAAMETYLANVVTGNRSATGQNIPSHLYAQMRTYALHSPGLLVVFAMSVAWWLRGPWRETDLFTFAAACSAAVLFFRLGRYGGNSMLYFYHLLSPLLLLAAFAFVARVPASRRWPVLLLLAVDFILLTWSAGRIPSSHAEVWAEWQNLLAPHRNVYAPPPLAAVLHRQGKPVYDAGLSDSFLYSMQNGIYPGDEVLRRRYEQFVADLSTQVREQRFDLIVLPYENDKPQFTFLASDLVQQHYRPVGKLELPMTWQPGWVGVVLEPRRSGL